MTCIAWDGKTLAADKRADIGGAHNTTTKIYRVGEALVGFSGDAAIGRAMLDWYRAGADPLKFPDCQKDRDKCCSFLVIKNGRVSKYEHTAFPFDIENEQTAMGSGRDYARAAMYLGKTATEAVAVASLFDPGCGNGIDTLTFTKDDQ